MWCGMVWYVMVWCGVVWYGVVWYGVVWCNVMWCGVVWCGGVWYHMMWCSVIRRYSILSYSAVFSSTRIPFYLLFPFISIFIIITSTTRTTTPSTIMITTMVYKCIFRTFQLNRYGPGCLLGATELCSRYRYYLLFCLRATYSYCVITNDY